MGYLTPNSIPDDKICYRISLPNDYFIIMAFMGAVSSLTQFWNWELFGEIEPEEIAQAMLPIYEAMTDARGECMIGSVVAFARSTLPDNFLFCDGSTYNAVDYPLLWDVIDSKFKNTGAGTFVVPDLRTRFVRGVSSDSQISTKGGNTNVVLSVANLPPHTHTYQQSISTVTADGEIPSVGLDANITSSTGSTGSGSSFDILPPYQFLKHGIQFR